LIWENWIGENNVTRRLYFERMYLQTHGHGHEAKGGVGVTTGGGGKKSEVAKRCTKRGWVVPGKAVTKTKNNNIRRRRKLEVRTCSLSPVTRFKIGALLSLGAPIIPFASGGGRDADSEKGKGGKYR